MLTEEAIMHATSTDLQNWDKHKENTLYADEEYSSDDFRDPYVFIMKMMKSIGCYDNKKNNMGVIAIYKSVDLIQWKNEKYFLKMIWDQIQIWNVLH